MFTLGIILLTIGGILKIWIKLSTREETRALSPQTISQRTSAIQLMKQRKRYGFIDSNILIAIGSILVLITAIFN
jgi:hypothetical protein